MTDGSLDVQIWQATIRLASHSNLPFRVESGCRLPVDHLGPAIPSFGGKYSEHVVAPNCLFAALAELLNSVFEN